MKRQGTRDSAGSAPHPTTKEHRDVFTNPATNDMRVHPTTTHVCEGNELAPLLATKSGRADGIARQMTNIQEVVVAE